MASDGWNPNIVALLMSPDRKALPMTSRPTQSGFADSHTDDDLPQLDPKVQGAIGRALQAHYDEITNAPLPDRFLALLAELEAKEQRHDG